MAFIGILLVTLVVFALALAAICGIIALIGFGVTSLIVGLVLAITGTAVTATSKKKILGIVLIAVAVLVLIPSSFLVFKIIGMLMAA